ncbi:MAG: kynureninase [Desulfobacula sp.]|jgi:kynureninase|uniref:kynureninase n=1 Tax=Desulfobacula sp. TaxID=2593537 RepID=UPI001D92B8C1|nr:kynureninase [Desulfobacula sp.]MBT3485310.1 kynureninase [Desulfobacula sp.]MBT3803630.1 kynureninase [Desulfobacula sp.]MBT4024205.1 kynureninase [Desulfobacula sp.]MBT4199319.1 kynureninase [Desulfobacula sp.]
MNYKFEPNEAFAKNLDSEDILSKFRNKFYIPEDTIYMDGNSLGLLSKDAEKNIARVTKEWKQNAIKGWMGGDKPWFYLPEEIGKKCARIIGADENEVILTGSTTVNIHSLISTFYNPSGRRTKILADELNFPSDIYALKGQILLKGFDPEKELILIKSENGRTLDENVIAASMTKDVALIFLPSVLYRSGQLLDMPYLINEAHKRGILIGFDCCHSAGVIPHEFSKWGLDFAVFCSYKYMNGGPGSPAFLYINKKHFDKKPILSGWFGCDKNKQFNMDIQFENQRSAGGWQISTQGLLSAAPVESALETILEAGMDNIREKSKKITDYLVYLVNVYLSKKPYHFKIGTPLDPEKRSGHIAIEHEKEAVRIGKSLLNNRVIPDFRPPNIIRMAPVPLYNTFHEVWEVVQTLKKIMDTKEYNNYSRDRGTVA